MIRVTIEEEVGQIVLRVEGKLNGPWVPELERCWRATSSRAGKKPLRAELSGVSFVDDSGKALLTEMFDNRVQLTATSPMIKALVEQIRSSATGRMYLPKTGSQRGKSSMS